MRRCGCFCYRFVRLAVPGVALILSIASAARAQVDAVLLGQRDPTGVRFGITGPSAPVDGVEPLVRKRYLPIGVFRDTGLQEWYTINYAQRPPVPPGSSFEQGRFFYDLYGELITQGFLVFDWTQASPLRQGSSVSPFNGFDGLVVASDVYGDYSARISVGAAIRTTLTPLTLSKARYNGIQLDLAGRSWRGSLLASRPSGFAASSFFGEGSNVRSNFTNLLGGRVEIDLLDRLTLGTTYVNVFNQQSTTPAIRGNPLGGTLTQAQNETITEIRVRVADDSPEDFGSGAALFSEELVLVRDDGRRYSNRRPMPFDGGVDSPQLAFDAVIEGGVRREGFLTAAGRESIGLKYNLLSPEYQAAGGPHVERIVDAMVLLRVANDYRIDVSSNAQRNEVGQNALLSDGIPERTLRAPGNVHDFSNETVVRLDIGLPTATEIFGMTLALRDMWGFEAEAEVDWNRQHSQYPVGLTGDVVDATHDVTKAMAWTLNVSRRRYPTFVFAEAYSMDPDYSTSHFLATQNGDTGPVLYDSRLRGVYELVDDNDDFDELPDWARINETDGDEDVFPGWDENGDFIADFNQNHVAGIRPNLQPDWAEPFLRYHVDRPEFLIGIDMNHNGIVDRFEDDERPDYPYPRDRRGYNLYGGRYLHPALRLTVGVMREREISSSRRNRAFYGMLTFDKDFVAAGRVRLHHQLHRVRDTIKDDVFVWRITDGNSGQRVFREDPLPGRNAWVHSLYADIVRDRENEHVAAKLRWDHWRHDSSPPGALGIPVLPTERLRRSSGFAGAMIRADIERHRLGVRWQPRVKVEAARVRPSALEDPLQMVSSEIRSTAYLLAAVGVLRNTEIQAGVERQRLWQMHDEAKMLRETGSRTETSGLMQVRNRTEYGGYELYTEMGVRLSSIDLQRFAGSSEEALIFLTMYAGFGS